MKTCPTILPSLLLALDVAAAVTPLEPKTETKEERKERFGRMRLDEAAPSIALEYVSGFLETPNADGQYMEQFLLMYFHCELGGNPTVTILGNAIQRDFPVSRLDDACQVYKQLVAAEASETATAQRRLDSWLRALQRGDSNSIDVVQPPAAGANNDVRGPQ